MTIKVAINGYGRIGRNILRAHYEGGKKHDIAIVAINDLGSPETNAHLTRYDTAHGKFPGKVEVDGDAMVVGTEKGGDRIKVFAMRDPAALPWGTLGVDVVLECTGLFTTKDKAGAHLKGGAKKVIISAPGGKDVDATIVYGVNHQVLKATDTVISNASCTTNCLAPLVKPLHDKIGVVNGLMTTVHSYTNDQVLTDVYHEDLRRARSATMSMIPTKTGAAAAVGLVLPELNGKLDGYAIRVPTINVSLVDLSFIAARDTTVDEVNSIMKAASESGPLKGHPELQHGTAGVDRLQPRSCIVHVRRHADQGVWTAGEGLELVRQRVGLFQPHARYHRRADERKVNPAGVVVREITLADVAGYRACVGAVMRERRFLAYLEPFSLTQTAAFVADNIDKGNPHYVADDAGGIVGWCDIQRESVPTYAHEGMLGMGLLPDYRGNRPGGTPDSHGARRRDSRRTSSGCRCRSTPATRAPWPCIERWDSSLKEREFAAARSTARTTTST
jgi:glyceraldehyde 3-phosphate dehydrogenase